MLFTGSTAQLSAGSRLPPSWLTRHKSFLLKYFFFRVGSELAFAFGKPSLRSTTCLPSWRKLHKRFLRKSQAYEKVIPSSICAWGRIYTGDFRI
jgi:hypothetical protein